MWHGMAHAFKSDYSILPSSNDYTTSCKNYNPALLRKYHLPFPTHNCFLYIYCHFILLYMRASFICLFWNLIFNLAAWIIERSLHVFIQRLCCWHRILISLNLKWTINTYGVKSKTDSFCKYSKKLPNFPVQWSKQNYKYSIIHGWV